VYYQPGVDSISRRAIGTYDQVGELGYAGRLATSFDDVIPEQGKKYKIWFNRPAGLTDSLIKIKKEPGKTVLQWYTAYWNNKSARRFNLTSDVKLVDGGKYLYVEGTGTGSNESFGKLGLDRYWAVGAPLWWKSMLQVWFRRGVEGVSYAMIADSDGYALVETTSGASLPSGVKASRPIEDPFKYAGEGAVVSSPGAPGSPLPKTPSKTSSTATTTATAKPFPTVPVIIGGVILVAIITSIVVATRKKTVAVISSSVANRMH